METQRYINFYARTNRLSAFIDKHRISKTVAVLNDLVMRASDADIPNARFAVIEAHREQKVELGWNLLKAVLLSPIHKPFVSEINEAEMSVAFDNGAIIRVYSADDVDDLRGNYFDGVVLENFDTMSSRIYTEVVAPAVCDRMGWVVFTGMKPEHENFIKLKAAAAKNPSQVQFLDYTAV